MQSLYIFGLFSLKPQAILLICRGIPLHYEYCRLKRVRDLQPHSRVLSRELYLSSQFAFKHCRLWFMNFRTDQVIAAIFVFWFYIIYGIYRNCPSTSEGVVNITLLSIQTYNPCSSPGAQKSSFHQVCSLLFAASRYYRCQNCITEVNSAINTAEAPNPLIF